MELLVPVITVSVGVFLIRRYSAVRAVSGYRKPVASVLRDTELGYAQITLLPRWRCADALNDQAGLQATDPLRQRFVVVISESREDFESSVDLSDHAARTLTQLSDSLRVIAINGPREIEVGGFKALQFEVEGFHNGIRLVYLHTTIEGRRAFHQVLAWAPRSRFDRQVFERLLAGFEELPGPDARIPAPPAVIIEAQTNSRYAVH